MREILFRAKRKDNGEWVYGDLINSWHKLNTKPTPMIYNTMGKTEVDPTTVSQFTGLTDKNGKKIFEGDICRFREWSKGDMCWIGKVHYEHQQFVISGHKDKECESDFLLVLSRFTPENIEIIGNIHDNPELLKGE